MTTGTDFHVGIVGLGSMGMGAARSCLRAGLSTWGPILTRKRARICSLKGLVGAAASARGVRRRRGCVSHSGRQCRPGQTGVIR